MAGNFFLKLRLWHGTDLKEGGILNGQLCDWQDEDISKTKEMLKSKVIEITHVTQLIATYLVFSSSYLLPGKGCRIFSCKTLQTMKTPSRFVMRISAILWLCGLMMKSMKTVRNLELNTLNESTEHTLLFAGFGFSMTSLNKKLILPYLNSFICKKPTHQRFLFGLLTSDFLS